MESGNKAEIVADYLYNKILDGTLPPGAVITEMELAESLNMSRSPIREGMRLLESRGALVRYRNRGSMVTTFTYDDVRDIFELRIAFEGAALKTAVSYMPEEKIQELKNALENLEDTDTTDTDRFNANFNIHKEIINCSGNKWLIRQYELLEIPIAMISRMSAKVPGHFIRSKGQHAEIVSAIEERNYQKAYDCLVDHLETVKTATLRFM